MEEAILMHVQSRLPSILFVYTQKIPILIASGHFCGAQDPTTTAEPLDVSEPDEGKAATTDEKLEPKQPGPVWKVQTMNQARHSIKVEVHSVRSSVLIEEGDPVSLQCGFKGPKNVSVTWRRSCSADCSKIFNSSDSENPKLSVDVDKGVSKLSFPRAKTSDSGMYYCIVKASAYEQQSSCGTYLWVRSECERCAPWEIVLKNKLKEVACK